MPNVFCLWVVCIRDKLFVQLAPTFLKDFYEVWFYRICMKSHNKWKKPRKIRPDSEKVRKYAILILVAGFTNV